MTELEKKLAQLMGTPDATEITPEALDSFQVVKKEAYKKLEDDKSKFEKDLKDEKTAHDALKKTNEDNVAILSALSPEAEEGKEQELITLEGAKELKKNADRGASNLTAEREEVVRLYKASLKEGDKPDENIVALINRSADSELESLGKQYGKKASGEYSGYCKDCKSENIEFRSSKEEEEVEETSFDSEESMSEHFRN